MVTFLQRTFTSLVHAHAGRTQVAPFDAAVYAPFCAFASFIVAQKSTTTAAQMSKALCILGKYEILQI
jgi:hypothetical protein